MTSRLLNATQQAGLLKVGDVMIPGDHEFPSFSRSQCANHVDRMLAYMNESDLNSVKLLLGLFHYLPSFVLRGLMALTEQQRLFPGAIGAALRMINIGLKGTVMTLYYSDLTESVSIYDLIKWDAKVVERESAANEAAGRPAASFDLS